MTWLATSKSNNAATTRGTQAAATPASLELPTTIVARGISPVKAIIEHLTATQCRLRAVVLLDRSEVLEFDVNLPGHRPMTARGRVVSCVSRPPRFIYTVSLDVMGERQIDELARNLATSYRAHRARLCDVASVGELPTTDGLTRARPRQPAQFTLYYRTAAGRPKAAVVTNVSTGGIRMTCSDALVDGEALELRFTLPSDVLDAYHEETTVLDLRRSQPRRVAPSRLRRPFQEMAVGARVVHHKPLGDGAYEFGLEFFGLDRVAHDEIARYVDAVRQAGSRRTKAG